MRITAGELKGRKVAGPKGLARPTSSKVREALFNIIGDRIDGGVFVDLYAGTGTVGMEAMSRQARTVYFVESDRKAKEAIDTLLGDCGCRSRAVIVLSRAEDFIRNAPANGLEADFVFLDPPYSSDELERVLPMLGEGMGLSDGALVIAEHPSRMELHRDIGAMSVQKTYKYGDTSLTKYRFER